MDIEQIKQLAQFLESSGLTVLEVCEGETKIRMERSAPCRPDAPPAYAQQPEAAAPPEPSRHDRLVEIKAPMVGVFYAAPSQDAEPYARPGDRVKKGDVLCQIEAMKLLNEIVAETDGEIADVCVQDGQVVEFAQTLFTILRAGED